MAGKGHRPPTGPGSVRRLAPAFSDARGTITDILVNGGIDGVTIITSHAGAIRGNHYHSETLQWIHVLRGSMRVTTQRPPSRPTATVVSQGDLVLQPPGERHAMRALEDCTFLVLTRGPRSGVHYETDTVRLPEPEWLERPEVR